MASKTAQDAPGSVVTILTEERAVKTFRRWKRHLRGRAAYASMAICSNSSGFPAR